MGTKYVFNIVGKDDFLLFSRPFVALQDEELHVDQFIIHASIDSIKEAMMCTDDLFLKCISVFGNSHVFGFVGVSGVMYILYCERNPNDSSAPSLSKIEDNTRSFMTEIHQLYVKLLLNPLYIPNTPILSLSFLQKVDQLAAKYFS
ncbi:hypothetical protein PCE1_003942 [Barthelona sp. PCE]